jgi:hypothetical protein
MTSFRITPGSALPKTKPGDTLQFVGTWNKGITIAHKDGITLDGTKAKITASATDGLMIYESDNVRAFGWDISGAKGSGLSVIRSHHFTGHHTKLHDNGDHGFYAQGSDHTEFARSHLYRNGQDGFSVFHPIAVDKAPGYHIIVRDNDVWGNGSAKYPTERWGGIFDDFNFTQNPSQPEFDFPSIIARNTIHGNKAAGIILAWSDHATLWKNKIAYNGTAADGTEEVRIHHSADATISGNIVIGDEDTFVFRGRESKPIDADGTDNWVIDSDGDSGIRQIGPGHLPDPAVNHFGDAPAWRPPVGWLDAAGVHANELDWW